MEEKYKQIVLEYALDYELQKYGLRTDKITNNNGILECSIVTCENSKKIEGKIELENSLYCDNNIEKKVRQFISHYFEKLY